MVSLHQQLINHNGCLVSMTNDQPQRYEKMLSELLQELPDSPLEPSPTSFTPSADRLIRAIEISSSVNYVAQSWKINDGSAADLGILSLLARNLSTGLLWDKIRVEGGAYGGMAMVSEAHPVFSCASYRDLNLQRTLETFSTSLKTMAAGISTAEVDQSIIGSISAFNQEEAKGIKLERQPLLPTNEQGNTTDEP